MRRILFLLLLLVSGAACAADWKVTEGDVTLRDFAFASGEKLPELRLHYRTLGHLHRDAHGRADNAVLIMHGTTGSGAQFLSPQFADELYGPGQPLDVAKYYIVLPDGIGHGKSSKPSDGLHAKFPRYGYADMVRAQHALLVEHLKVDHARLVMGTSMGGMHTWVWGETYPDYMDALMPLASLPVQVSGRNRVWRRMFASAIRNDPSWKDGEYRDQPQGLRHALDLLLFMGSVPLQWQHDYPTRDSADAFYEKWMAERLKTSDANDMLYAVEASSDYDPQPQLAAIQAPLVAINSADDQINPPELGILEREIGKVAHGRALVLPISERTRGHGTHTWAALWKDQLVNLLRDAPVR